MLLTVSINNVKKGKAVLLSKSLPTDHGFGNTQPLPKDTKGYVLSDGFVAGSLIVEFNTYAFGRQRTKFNELSAREYLVTDIY